jgi:hypothetical protein
MALVGCLRVRPQRCTWSAGGITADVNAAPVPMRDALGIEQPNHVLLAWTATRYRPISSVRYHRSVDARRARSVVALRAT